MTDESRTAPGVAGSFRGNSALATAASGDPVREAGKRIGEYLPKELDPSPQAAAGRLLAFLDWEGEGYGSVGPALYYADVRTVANALCKAPDQAQPPGEQHDPSIPCEKHGNIACSECYV